VRVWQLMAVAAALDLAVAAALWVVGLTAFAVFMLAVAVGGAVFTVVLWRRGR
jgi:hypothetical protein